MKINFINILINLNIKEPNIFLKLYINLCLIKI